MTLIFRTD